MKKDIKTIAILGDGGWGAMLTRMREGKDGTKAVNAFGGW